MTGIAISKMRQSGGNTVAGAQMYENAWPEHIMSEEDFYPTNPKYQKYILPDVKPVPGANYGTTVEQRHGMYGNTQYKAGEVRNKPAKKESLPSRNQQSAAPQKNRKHLLHPDHVPKAIDNRPVRPEDIPNSSQSSSQRNKAKEPFGNKRKSKGKGESKGLLLDDEQKKGLIY